MSALRFRPMKVSDTLKLPQPCGDCTFWESGLADLASLRDNRAPHQKQGWASAVTQRWGYCGVVAVQDGDIVGYLTMAPESLAPRLGAFAIPPFHDDAAVVLTARVEPEFRGHGTGRHLVQSAAALAAKRDLRALEAIGTYRNAPSCMLAVSWLESVGFTLDRAHPVSPRMRMDLQTTVRWRSDLGAAWHRLTGLVSQPAPPEPARVRTHGPNSRPAFPPRCVRVSVGPGPQLRGRWLSE